MKWIQSIYLGLIALFIVASMHSATAQCNGIDFVPDQTQVCAPKLVKFIVQNNPVGASYTWDYGFGQANGKDTGQYIYTTAGTYTVTLKITLSDGTVCTVTKSNIIEVFTPPTPLFVVSRPVLCNGADTVSITDISTGGTTRTWSVDGLPLPDTSAKIVLAFTSVGYKDIVLAINSAKCPTAYYQQNGAVRIYNPLSFDFEADTTKGCAPALITFKATNITQGHSIGIYDWSFAGGTPATSAASKPSIQYSAGGTYNVSLNLTNTDGCTHLVNKIDYLVLGDTTGFTVSSNKNQGCRGEEFIIDASNPGVPGTFTWDFGTGVSQAGSSPTSQRVIFNDTGLQTITVTRENSGCAVTRTFNKLIHITPPLANFIVLNPFECDSTARVYLFNRAKLAPGYNHTYLWKFYDNDGNIEATSSDSIPVFFTSRNYSYSLELVVYSSNGCADSIFKQSCINRRGGVAKFIVNPETSCPGKSVSIVSTTNQFSSGEPNVYEWIIYDKNGVDILKFQNTGAMPYTVYTFGDTGTYPIRLRVYNSKCSDTAINSNSIAVLKPTTSIAISDTEPCVKNIINLSASSIPSIAPNFYSYSWLAINASDTSIKIQATGPSVSITPDKPGNYNIRLITQWGNNTCADTTQTLGQLKISAPVISVAYSNPSGCVPLTGNASSVIKDNHNYKNPANNTIIYTWLSTPAAGVIIASPNAPSTQITYTKQGSYTLALIAENGSGCKDTFMFAAPINAGVRAGFTSIKPAVCVGDTATITNQSSLSPQAYQWFSFPPVPIFLPSANVANPKVYFPDSGFYTLSQVVSKNNSCYDTATTIIQSIKTIADFSTADTDKYCSPVPVNFVNKSINADSLIWYTGDGKFVRSTSIASLPYVYFTNSGTQGFDVKLIAQNNIGCKDSFTRTSYITILGPVPLFTANTDVGCNPLTVTYTDKSTDYEQYYFDYGDGSNFDSTGNPGTHTYQNTTTVSEATQYKPKVFLIDKQGCLATYQYPGTIRVNNNPLIQVTAQPDSGCIPLLVAFKDSTKFATTLSWDFDDDGIQNSTKHNPTFEYKNDGIYTVMLKATSQYGCVTTDTLKNYIHAFGLPTAGFSVAKDNNDTADIFYSLNNQSANFNTIEWFADSVFIGTTPFLQYAFPDTGYHHVRLVAITDKGCRDTADSIIYIVPDYFFYVPNAFTPNGKGGNETFGLYAPLWAKRFIMRIYNRYGQLLFETNEVARQWDGTYKNQPCQQDTYMYTIEYLDIYSKWHVFKGTVHLLR